MKKLSALMLLGALFIAGCSGSGSTPTSTTQLKGNVADGYLENALVFLDKDGDYQLDEGEPSTTTDANGAYTLNVAPEEVGA